MKDEERKIIEDFKRKLRLRWLDTAKSWDEKFGFEIRDGVTYRGIEAFSGNRLYQVDPKRVLYNAGIGKLDLYIDRVITTLRTRSALPPKLHLYRVQDLVREQSYFLRDLLAKAIGTEDADRAFEAAADAVRERAKGEKLGDAALFRQVSNDLADAIANEVEYKRQRGKTKN